MNQSESKENPEEAIRQAQQQFWTALKNKDKVAFEDVLAANFIARSSGEPNQGRAEFINSLTDFPVQVLSIGSDDLEVHVWGDIAAVTGLQLAKVRLPDGQEKLNRIAITNIYQRKEGRWVLTLAHAVPLD